MAAPVQFESAENELLPLEGSTSLVWKYFGFPGKDGKIFESDKKKRTKVYCKLCSRSYSYVGNTTNMWQHLEDNHANEFREAKTSGSDGKKKENQQMKIAEAFQSSQQLSHSSVRWKTLTDSVCYFIAKDLQPYDTVNDAGFRHMIKTFEPRYTPPDRKTIATNYMPKMYDKEKGKVKAKVAEVKSFALTTDIWTSRANHSYTGLTIHYISKDFQLASHLLETKEFPESHTGNNIADELIAILSEWNLDHQMLSAVTTDNGSNIVLATDILNWSRMPCFSHSLHLAVEAAMRLSRVSQALARCKRLVGHFHHSAKSSYTLKKKQLDLQHSTHALVQDITTRWNSSYYMVERIISQQQPLCATLLELRRGDLMPSDAELSTMEAFCRVMKPLVSITEAIGAEKWVTISSVRPLLHKLLNSYLKTQAEDDEQEKMMKKAMRDKLSCRYTGSILMMLNIAAFLDPRFRSLSYLSEEERLS